MSNPIVKRLMKNHRTIDNMINENYELYEADDDKNEEEEDDSGYPGIDVRDKPNYVPHKGVDNEVDIDFDDDIPEDTPDDEATGDTEVPDNEESEVPDTGEVPDEGESNIPAVGSTHSSQGGKSLEPDSRGEEVPSDDTTSSQGKDQYVNPLDNPYAVKHGLGDEVSLDYLEGNSNKSLSGKVEGYDPEGFYKIRWSDGSVTNGITDIALQDIVKKTHESKCVCGCTNLLKEGRYIVCDDCGRQIKESAIDNLAELDKQRSRGKRMIRSIAHPVSTSHPEATISESNDVEGARSILQTINGKFWTKQMEMEQDIESLGFEILESDSEHLVVAIGEDEYVLPIIGTSRTMTIDLDKIK